MDITIGKNDPYINHKNQIKLYCCKKDNSVDICIITCYHTISDKITIKNTFIKRHTYYTDVFLAL